MSAALDRVLERLRNVEPNGSGYKASCPVVGHGKGRGDQNPSLRITEGDDGRALLVCQAGCEVEEVVEALGLKMSDLFEGRNGKGGRGVVPLRKRVDT